MRLKASLSVPGGADRFQLRKFYPEQWLPSRDTEVKTKSACSDVRCQSYNPDMASPMEDDTMDHSVVLCANADDSGDTEDDDDSSTDSDFSETSPLLADFDEDSVDDEEDDQGKDDCNNNLCRSVQTSQDSLLSDPFNMSALKDHHLAVENFRNNNNLSSLNGPFSGYELPSRVSLVQEDARDTFFTRTREKFPASEIGITAFSDEAVCPTNKCVVSNSRSDSLTIANHVQTQCIPDALKQEEINQNEADSASLTEEVSPMSDSSTNSDNDVNLESHVFNNFTLAPSKHNDILYLVQQEKKPKEINILDAETKILNTTSCSLPIDMTRAYQFRNDYSRTSDTRTGGLRDSCSSSQLHSLIADSLVLEKVEPDDNWQNHTIYSSGDVMKQFAAEYSLVNCKSEPKTEPACDNVDTLKNNHDQYSIGNDVLLPNLCPNDPRLSSPPRKKDGDGLKEASLSLRGVTDEVACVMDIESPIDNLDPVTSMPREVPQKDENDNRAGDVYEQEKCDNDQTSSSLVTQEKSVVVHPSCGEAEPTKGKSKSTTPKKELLEDFDVYNIETTMPTIDWVAMEAHLTRAAAEDDWLVRRRNDREEIRKKLAMDSDTEEYYCGERVTRKPSLSTRLQSGMNLQICFMNETASDQESQGSDHDTDSGQSDLSCTNRRTPTPPGDRIPICFANNSSTAPLTRQCEEANTGVADSNSNRLISVSEKNSLNSQNVSNGNETPHKKQRPSFFFARQKSWRLRPKQKSAEDKEEKGASQSHDARFDPAEDFYTRHARLQAEARMALAQAKEMARMQMEVERQKSKKSPIADIVGLPFPDNRHRLSRQILTDMNVAQLQVIVNDLHTQIENLNEDLVQLLLTRDDLHMEQDSMLVDIEDLTRYFRAKDEAQHQPVTNAHCKLTSKK